MKFIICYKYKPDFEYFTVNREYIRETPAPHLPKTDLEHQKNILQTGSGARKPFLSKLYDS